MHRSEQKSANQMTFNEKISLKTLFDILCLDSFFTTMYGFMLESKLERCLKTCTNALSMVARFEIGKLNGTESKLGW